MSLENQKEKMLFKKSKAFKLNLKRQLTQTLIE